MAENGVSSSRTPWAALDETAAPEVPIQELICGVALALPVPEMEKAL